MNTTQEKAIWIVDDDSDDRELILEIFTDMDWKYKLELFSTGDQLLNRLDVAPAAPFIIISDMNMPKKDGFTLREETLKVKVSSV